MSQRQQRVADMLQGELASILMTGVKDPRVRLATVSKLEVSRDLSYARVLVSVLGSDEERERCIEGLHRARGYIRSQLASRVRLRTVPELRFELDRGAEHQEHMHSLLASLDVKPEDDADDA
ncbi:MAG: 30S ribosome-binding factor RbfA [Acidobacteriota bacterium]